MDKKKIAKVLFFDRDGTIIEDRHYLNEVSKISWIEGAIDFIGLAQRNDFLCILITNQSGVAKGIISPENLQKIHDRLNRDLQELGYRAFDGIYICPHDEEDQCLCRKPKEELFLRALRDLKNKELTINLDQSWALGDRMRDLLPAHRIGIKNLAMIRPMEDELEKLKKNQDLLALVKNTQHYNQLRDLIF